MRRNDARRASPVVLAALLGGCGGTPSNAPRPVADAPLTSPAAIAGDWAVARPADVGLDEGAVTAAANAIRRGERGTLHSLLVVRRGRLAVEEYFAGSSREDVHTQQSVTKSVTSLLVGIAIDQGLIRSAREPVLSFFPEHSDLRGGDARRDAMTLEDLLTMRTGLLWTEEPYGGSDLERLNQS